MRRERKVINRVKAALAVSMIVPVCMGSCGMVSYAAETDIKTESSLSGIHSRGKILFGGNENGRESENIIYDSADIREIYDYLLEQKTAVFGRLLQLGTKFVQSADGWRFHRYPEDAIETIQNIPDIGWDVLFDAIESSQNVPEDIPVKEPVICLQIEGIEEYTDLYKAAAAEHISAGKAAWNEGGLLLGTGADNEKAYEKGKEDGARGEYNPAWTPVLTAVESETMIKHKHIGSAIDEDCQSGCYHNYHTVAVVTTSCGASLQQTDSTWYPNESEEGGGSWHGGYYTCPWHGGIYDGAGTCDYEDSAETIEWHHDITCGKGDLPYAVIKITGKENNEYSDSFVLQAELIEKDGFPNLTLTQEEYLVWHNESREIIGYGKNLEVSNAGTYYCSIAASNQDVDVLSGGIKVTVKGFMWD